MEGIIEEILLHVFASQKSRYVKRTKNRLRKNLKVIDNFMSFDWSFSSDY